MPEQPELLTYLNGRVMPHSQAVATLQQSGMESAGGFYDAERTFGGKLFKLRQHLDRLYRGLSSGSIDPGLSIDEMESIILGLLESNRSLLERGDEYTVTQVVSLGQAQPAEDGPEVVVFIYCQPLDFSAFAIGYLKGVALVTPQTYGVPAESQGNRKEDGRQVIPLMSNREGTITECAGANFMFVRDGRIKLPNRGNVLPGVSMQTVLELAESLGFPVDEGDYSTLDVYMADEAFISSTRYCMLPVATINGLRLDDELPGPVTRRILEAWQGEVGMDFVQQALDHLPSGDDEG